MKKPSQTSQILKLLRTNGQVTRNEALKLYISRLSSIMLILKNEGVNFRAEDMENGDYKYTLLDKPKIIPYFINGEQVTQKVIWDNKNI